MTRASTSQGGYLMSEETYLEIMQGIESLRFLEGLACMAAGSRLNSTPQFDVDDMAGYIQLLLLHTHKPLKALEYQHWQPVPRPQPKAAPLAAKSAPPVELDPAEEEELLRNYRRLPAGDRQHLRRCAEALAFLVEKEADAG